MHQTLFSPTKADRQASINQVAITVGVLVVMSFGIGCTSEQERSPVGTFEITTSLPEGLLNGRIVVKSLLADSSGLYFEVAVGSESGSADLPNSAIVRFGLEGNFREVIARGMELVGVDDSGNIFACRARNRQSGLGREIVLLDPDGVPLQAKRLNERFSQLTTMDGSIIGLTERGELKVFSFLDREGATTHVHRVFKGSLGIPPLISAIGSERVLLVNRIEGSAFTFDLFSGTVQSLLLDGPGFSQARKAVRLLEITDPSSPEGRDSDSEECRPYRRLSFLVQQIAQTDGMGREFVVLGSQRLAHGVLVVGLDEDAKVTERYRFKLPSFRAHRSPANRNGYLPPSMIAATGNHFFIADTLGTVVMYRIG